MPAETEITKSLLAVLAHFNWRKITVIYEKKATTDELYNAIKRGFEAENLAASAATAQGESPPPPYTVLNVSHVAYPFSEVSPTETEKLRDIIQETHEHTRSKRSGRRTFASRLPLVYVTFGNVRMFRRILFLMGSAGMMDQGEHVIIYLDTDFYWLDVYDAMNNHFFRGSSVLCFRM